MAAISEVTLLNQGAVSVIEGEDCSSLLRGYGSAPKDLWKDPIVVEGGAPLLLEGEASTPLFRQILRTNDIEQFKNWIGVSNALIRSGKYLPPPVFPQIPARRLEQASDRLSREEAADLRLAYNYFFFGNSDLVEDYRTALHIHFAPFEAVLYGGDLVEICSDASIEVRERPAILLFRELVIHAGGCLRLFTPCRMNADIVRKLPA